MYCIYIYIYGSFISYLNVYMYIYVCIYIYIYMYDMCVIVYGTLVSWKGLPEQIPGSTKEL